MISAVDNYYALITPLILEQYKKSTNLLGLVALFMSHLDRAEAGLWELNDLMSIDKSEGVQLDLLGDIIGLARGVSDDLTYRVRLKMKAGLYASGTAPDIQKAIFDLTGSTEVLLFPEWPAGYWIIPNILTNLTYAWLESISCNGVQPFIGAFLVQASDRKPIVTASRGENILVVNRLTQALLGYLQTEDFSVLYTEDTEDVVILTEDSADA